MDALPAPKKFSLTAHLARAAANRPGYRGVETPEPAESPSTSAGPSPEATRAATPKLAADGVRCTSSVISGQRCARIAPKGQALCTGHAAMAGSGHAAKG